MDNSDFQDKIRREAETMAIARKILGIGERASADEVKRAWREKCLETHPDRSPGDPEAEKKFQIVTCAYRLLVDGTPCDDLLNAGESLERPPGNDKYNLDNSWGMFLWWREKFF